MVDPSSDIMAVSMKPEGNNGSGMTAYVGLGWVSFVDSVIGWVVEVGAAVDVGTVTEDVVTGSVSCVCDGPGVVPGFVSFELRAHELAISARKRSILSNRYFNDFLRIIIISLQVLYFPKTLD